MTLPADNHVHSEWSWDTGVAHESSGHTWMSSEALLNRPGVFGDWIPWKDDSYGTSLEVSAGAA